MEQNYIQAVKSFESQVMQITAPLFRQENLAHIATLTTFDADKIDVVFGSHMLKVSIYQWKSQGEINCMVGPPHSNIDQIWSPEWTFLYDVLYGPKNLSIEQIRTMFPDAWKSYLVQLKNIVRDLETNFDTIKGQIQQQESQNV